MEEREIPGADSPIESVREIQMDRARQEALNAPQPRVPLCTIYMKGEELQVESRLPADALLKALGTAYLAIYKQASPDTRVQVPKCLIVVP